MIFAGPAERIELVHKAEDRMIFARGALKAALWARGQKPGLYSMADVLGLGDFRRELAVMAAERHPEAISELERWVTGASASAPMARNNVRP